MTTYTGRQTVEAGIYLNTTTYSITTMDKGGTLPGDELENYRRVPMIVMLAAAPILGLAYVMFLPLVGFAMVLHLVGRKAGHAVTAAVAEGLRVVRPSWAPALAFLTRTKKTTPVAPTTTEPDAWTDDVEKKLNQDDDTSRTR